MRPITARITLLMATVASLARRHCPACLRPDYRALASRIPQALPPIATTFLRRRPISRRRRPLTNSCRTPAWHRHLLRSQVCSICCISGSTSNRQAIHWIAVTVNLLRSYWSYYLICSNDRLIIFFLQTESPTYAVVENSSPPLTIKSDSTPTNNSRRSKEATAEGLFPFFPLFSLNS